MGRRRLCSCIYRWVVRVVSGLRGLSPSLCGHRLRHCHRRVKFVAVGLDSPLLGCVGLDIHCCWIELTANPSHRCGCRCCCWGCVLVGLDPRLCWILVGLGAYRWCWVRLAVVGCLSLLGFFIWVGFVMLVVSGMEQAKKGKRKKQNHDICRGSFSGCTSWASHSMGLP